SIRSIKHFEHRPGGGIYEFIYDRDLYLIIIDGVAGDDISYLEDVVKQYQPKLKGKFVDNAHGGNNGYGMPFKGKDVYMFQVKAATDRLDNELRRRFPDISRSTLQKYIKEGYVAVRGNIAS